MKSIYNWQQKQQKFSDILYSNMHYCDANQREQKTDRLNYYISICIFVWITELIYTSEKYAILITKTAEILQLIILQNSLLQCQSKVAKNWLAGKQNVSPTNNKKQQKFSKLLYSSMEIKEKKQIDRLNYQDWSFWKLGINFNNFTRNWRINITCCFNTLHCSKATTFGHFTPRFRQINKHHISQMTLHNNVLKKSPSNGQLGFKFCSPGRGQWCQQ